MKDYQSAGHVKWDCTYHIVIIPKYRKRVLFGDVRQRVGQIIRELAKRKDVEVVKGNALPDHIHMILKIPPRYSVAEIMGFLKGKSAIRAHTEFSKKRRPLAQKSFWSRGYCVSTVGIDIEVIKKYVQDQWKKDKYNDGPQLDLHWD
jgi:putative transposase